MLALYIDASGTVQIEEDLDVFKCTLRKWNIWSKLFSVEGKEKTIIINRPGYKRALSVATMMTEKIIDESADIELLTTVEESCDAIKLMSAVQRKYNAHQLSELLRSQKEHIYSAKKDCEFLKRIFQQLVSIHQGRIPDLESMHDVYQKKERHLSLGKSIKLKELKDKSFWEPFSSILQTDTRNMWKLLDSKIFWALNENILDTIPTVSGLSAASETENLELSSLFEGEPVPGTANDPPYALHVIRMLHEDGVKSYRSTWEPLFEETNVSVASIKPLVDDVDLEKEIAIVQSLFSRSLPVGMATALKAASDYHGYDGKLKVLSGVLEALSIDVSGDENYRRTLSVFEVLHKSSFENVYLKRLEDISRMLSIIDNLVDDEFVNVLQELCKSSSLVRFLEEIGTDDVRNLIDAVEEHSEQSVQEYTVSSLIDVKRFLNPLKHEGCCTVEKVLLLLKRSAKDDDMCELAKKVSECNTHLHSLKSLFYNVANRGEVTRKTVERVLHGKSTLFFTVTDKQCYVTLKNIHENVKYQHKRSDLNDLRSRVLLIVNTYTKGKQQSAKSKEKGKEELKKFIDIIDNALDLASILEQLNKAGHPNPKYKEEVAVKMLRLKDCLSDLKHKFDIWKATLKENRRKYYWLSFFYPEQLKTLYNYFMHGQDEAIVCRLISFTGFSKTCLLDARAIYANVAEELNEENVGFGVSLHLIGKSLDLILRDKSRYHVGFQLEDSTRICDTVQKGHLYVVGVQEKCDTIINTLLSLYRNTTGCIPLPYQVFFCQEDTVWEDIDLLLMQCQGAGNEQHAQGPKQLFALVSVEKLQSDVQHQLVDALKAVAESAYLAVICQGTSHHPFLDHFIGNVHHVQPLSHKDMETVLQTLHPKVLTVLSDVSGQGKTEFINEQAHKQEYFKHTLHISGKVAYKDLISKLNELEINPHECLHIDIGEVSNTRELDIFLFQLIVMKFVRHGAESHTMNTDCIFIEIANTINSTLRDTLQLARYFQRKHITWEDYDNFIVSLEVSSPVQVVCHYLDLLRKGTIDITDIYFSGTNRVPALSDDRCRCLLKEYFPNNTDMSFSLVNIFLNVLSDQLKKLSCSYFFRTANIKTMIKDSQNVKTEVFKAMLDVSREFSMRSVHASRQEQRCTIENLHKNVSSEMSAEALMKRMKGLIQWEETNHLFIAFHNQDIQTLSALYRSKEHVPEHIVELFETQVRQKIPEFATLDQNTLQEMLLRIAQYKEGSTSRERLQEIANSYALTPDNLLKMALIILRIRAHIPVILMGETGCGKTSLIRYLSVVCGVQFEVMNIHAGIEEEDINVKVQKVNSYALKHLDDDVWLFLDEINTCSHLGVITDIVCHHRCFGEALAPNLTILAACNPYKLREEVQIFTAGLESKVKGDEKSKLVYRVNPLPERMMDYVWDYGCLSAADELSYIRRMVTGTLSPCLLPVDCLAELLIMSQDFIRKTQIAESCVSLRDVRRCQILIRWFCSTLEKKSKLQAETYPVETLQVRAIVLALAHSYHCRIPDALTRKEYRQNIADVFVKYNKSHTNDSVYAMIQEEQKDILQRMKLPPGTAQNTALQENVFVILVCILNQIPVFVVGKPGCSKSLSLQLIKSNLRGKDSEDPYFKTLPHLYCVSYQGSELSTSDDILKVFEKAIRYRKLNKKEEVLPVVVLDEIGLAETSRFNPLKVLHSLLEPCESELPEVAVVGISNWALDAAKMNRAIHLSRPDMDAEELYHTGVSISRAISESVTKPRSLFAPSSNVQRDTDDILIHAIANAYAEYTETQTIPNFHGLRDFYSFVKYIAQKFNETEQFETDPASTEVKFNIVMKGLLRNFGGLSSGNGPVLTVFKKHLRKAKCDFEMSQSETISVIQLIEENITDMSSRHLLLATRSDSALSIVEDVLNQTKREYVIILGSSFREDMTDDYNYRILSKIILYMEQGVVLILKDLQHIYGSMYDMLNQNYTIVGKKNNCRIALGANSYPLCQVHDRFRCIVLVEEEKLDLSDPPFLNRFEKQNIQLCDALSSTEKKQVIDLDRWIDQMSKIDGYTFSRTDLVPVDSPDMIPSLVHCVYLQKQEENDLESRCKSFLLKACSPEAILRLEHSELFRENPHAVHEHRQYYFTLPVHKGLGCYIDHKKETALPQENLKEMIFTHSNLHTNVLPCFGSDGEYCQIEKLSAFKSEKQLTRRIQKFWSHPDKQWLIIQCAPTIDKDNILLMKSIADKEQKNFSEGEHTKQKHVIIVMHLDRNAKESLGSVNFLSGWNIAFMDCLLDKHETLIDLIHKTKIEVMKDRRPMTDYLTQNLFWAFTTIRYSDNTRSLSNLREIMKILSSDEHLLQFLEEFIVYEVQKHDDQDDSEHWQLDVALDKLKLYKSLTLHDALEQEITASINYPLAALVYQLELMNSWDSVTTLLCGDKRKKDVWINCTKRFIDIHHIPPPDGPECYPVVDSVLKLRVPFSKIFMERIETLRQPFMEAFQSEFYDVDIQDISYESKGKLCDQFHDAIRKIAREMIENIYDEDLQISEYLDDLCHFLFSKYNFKLDADQRAAVAKWSLISRLPEDHVSFGYAVSRLHVYSWLYSRHIEAEIRLVDKCHEMTRGKLTLIPLQDLIPSRDFSEIFVPYKTTCSTQTENEDELLGALASPDHELSVMDHRSDIYPRFEQKENQTKEIVREQESSFEENNTDYIGVSLVNFACRQMIPTQPLITLSGTSWMKNVSLVLSLASDVSLESKIFQSLRMCSDFTILVLSPMDLPIERVAVLGEALKTDTLESEVIFKKVTEMIAKLHEENHAYDDSLRHFFACFTGNCLAADPETPLFDWIFDELNVMPLFQNSLAYFGPTLHQALMIEIGDSDIINDEAAIQDSLVLLKLDTAIQRHHEPDSELACLCVDIFQVNFFKQLDLDTDNMNKMLKYDQVFKAEGLSLRQLFALAFLKSMIKCFVCQLKKKVIMEVNVLQKFSAMLMSTDSSGHSLLSLRTKSLQSFFWKILAQDPGLRIIEEVVQNFQTSLPVIKEHGITENDRMLALELCPMELTFPEFYDQARNAYLNLPDSSDMLQEIIQNSGSNHQMIYVLFALALQKIYLVQTVQPLSDSERQEKVKVFWQMCKESLNVSQQHVLKCLCTLDDFGFQLFQMDPHKLTEDHHAAICSLHLISSVVAYHGDAQHTLWLQCLLKPVDLEQVYVPGNGFVETGLHASKFPPRNFNCSSCSVFKCECSTVTVLKNDTKEIACPVCHVVFEEIDYPKPILSEDRKFVSRKGYTYVSVDSLECEFLTVRDLSPTSFRVLLISIHICLAGCLALKNITAQHLSEALHLPDTVEITSYLKDHILCHWSALKKLTRFGDAQLAKLMNFIFRDGMPLFAQNVTHFDDESKLKDYELQLTNYIDQIIGKRFKIVQEEVKLFRERHPDSTASHFEVSLAEILEDENRLGTLPRLLREISEPSYQDMKCEYTITKQCLKYQAIGLLFDKQQHLSLLQHLVPIIQWHMCILRQGCLKLKRADSHERKVGDFVHASDRKKELLGRFESFKSAWNQLREKQDCLREYNSAIPDMERVNSLSVLDCCVITTIHSPIMQVLRALQLIQNQFLVNAAALSLSGNNVLLNFLKQDDHSAVLSEVAIEHIAQKQVISVPNLTHVLKFSQVNPMQGHGRQRQYDFFQIEAPVIDECLINKPFIVINESFPTVGYSDESLNKINEMLQVIIQKVGLKPLDNELKNIVLQSQDDSPSNMQTLLDYLNMTFSLISRTPVQEYHSEETMSTFISPWQALFPKQANDLGVLFSKIHLSQLVSLYGFVEDLVAEVMLDCLEDKYRIPMSKECEDHLKKLVDVWTIDTLEALLSALKKIVLRHLQFARANTDFSLSSLLMEETIWPQGVMEDAVSKSTNPKAGLLHKNHCVETIHATIGYIRGTLKVSTLGNCDCVLSNIKKSPGRWSTLVVKALHNEGPGSVSHLSTDYEAHFWCPPQEYC